MGNKEKKGADVSVTHKMFAQVILHRGVLHSTLLLYFSALHCTAFYCTVYTVQYKAVQCSVYCTVYSTQQQSLSGQLMEDQLNTVSLQVPQTLCRIYSEHTIHHCIKLCSAHYSVARPNGLTSCYSGIKTQHTSIIPLALAAKSQGRATI